MKRGISLPLYLLLVVLLAAACGGSGVPSGGEGGAPAPAPTVGGSGSAAPAVSSTSAVPDAVAPAATSSTVSSTSVNVAGGSSTSIVPTTTPPVTTTAASTTTISVTATSAATTSSSTTEAPVGVSCSEGSAYSRDLEVCVEPPLSPENLRAQPGHEHLILYWSPGAFWPDPAPVEEWLVSLYDSEGSLLHESDRSSEPVTGRDEWGYEYTIEEARKFDVEFFLDYETPPGSEPMVRLRGGVVYRVGVRAVNAAGMSEEVFVESSPCVDCAPPPPPPIPVVEEVSEGGFVSVSAGWAYSCGLRVDRSVECWEWMADDMFRPDKGSGYGWSEDASTLTPPWGEFTVVDAGWEYACGLRPSGGVECWGRNPAAGVEPPEGEFTSVSVGIEHACALRPSEEVECWGWVWRGYRGHFARPPEGPFTAIAAGAMGSFAGFLCGLRPGGEVECWGGDFDEDLKPPGGVFESIDGEGGVICGVRPDREVECWWEISSDEEPYSSTSGEFSMVSAGQWRYSCGLRFSGVVECWDNVPEGRAAPAPEGEFIWVSVGRSVACGLPVDGGVVCWDIQTAGSPWWLSEGEFKSISSGWSHHCGLRVDGEVECWSRLEEEFGEASPPSGRFESVSVDDYYSCGLRPSGEVECWGSDEFGKSTPPAGVFTQITTARDYACGLRPDGEVECWGGSEFGWLLSKVTPPEERLVSVDTGWGGHEENSFFVGSSLWRPDDMDWGYSCGLRADRQPICWGGEISITGGLGDTVREEHPILFPPEGEFLDVEAGRFRACGLRPSGEMECWGLFDVPDDEGRFTPRGGLAVLNPDPASGEGFVDVDVGGWHACGLRPSGEVACWDSSSTDGFTLLDDLYEYELEGPYEMISSGYRHACGLRRDGGVDCWGYTGYLQRLEEAPN